MTPRRRTALAIIATLAIAHPALAQDRPSLARATEGNVIGLLSLPEVFGSRQCAPFEPIDVALHAAPNDGKVMALIRVDRNWSFAPHGGCEGLAVSIHEGAARSELPTREFDYEMPGAIVLEQRDRWFRIRSSRGTAWLQASAADRFMPLSDLFEEFAGVTAINPPYNGRLVEAPGRSISASSPRVVATQPARVIEMRSTFGEQWVQVEILSHSICDAGREGPPEIVATGWMPMHAPNGEPTIWFSSRGC
jgi:hypothetical protein